MSFKISEVNNSEIKTEEIKQDIRDTLAEITTMDREEKGYRIIGDRLSVMKADYRSNGIIERKAFIKKLEQILLDRGE